jgi:hypothetical protein
MTQEEDFPDDLKVQPEQMEQEPLKVSPRRYRSFAKVLMAIVNISLSAFYFGYTILYLSVIDFGTVIKIYGIEMEPSTAEGILTFCVPLGGLFGALSSSYFIRNLSRR